MQDQMNANPARQGRVPWNKGKLTGAKPPLRPKHVWSIRTKLRVTVRQKKNGRPVRFELSEQTREAIDDYLKAANKRSGEFLFTGRRGPETSMTTRQYARLVSEWIGSIGLDPRLFGTHSLRRTKATLIYRRMGNLRAVQLLLGRATYCPRTTG